MIFRVLEYILGKVFRYFFQKNNSNPLVTKSGIISQVIFLTISIVVAGIAIFIAIFIGMILSSGHGSTLEGMMPIYIVIGIFTVPSLLPVFFQGRKLYKKIKIMRTRPMNQGDISSIESVKSADTNIGAILQKEFDSIDISGIDSVHFHCLNGLSFQLANPEVKKIAVSIYNRSGKCIFQPNELYQEEMLLKNHFHPSFKSVEYERVLNLLSEWVLVGGTMEIKLKEIQIFTDEKFIFQKILQYLPEIFIFIIPAGVFYLIYGNISESIRNSGEGIGGTGGAIFIGIPMAIYLSSFIVIPSIVLGIILRLTRRKNK